MLISYLADGAVRRRGDRTLDHRGRPQRRPGAGRHPRRVDLRPHHRHRGQRARRDRHPGQQRGLPDGPAGRHRRGHHGAVRPRPQDEPVRDVLADEEGAAAPAAGLDHHQQLVDPGDLPVAGAVRLRAHQGRHPQLHEVDGPGSGRPRHPGQCGRPRPDLDAVDPGDDDRGQDREPRSRMSHSAGPASRRSSRPPTSSSPRRSPATSPRRCSGSPAASPPTEPAAGGSWSTPTSATGNPGHRYSQRKRKPPRSGWWRGPFTLPLRGARSRA